MIYLLPQHVPKNHKFKFNVFFILLGYLVGVKRIIRKLSKFISKLNAPFFILLGYLAFLNLSMFIWCLADYSLALNINLKIKRDQMSDKLLDASESDD